jgi:hypothetical protein
MLLVKGIVKGKVINFYITLNVLSEKEMQPSSCKILVLSLISINSPGITAD